MAAKPFKMIFAEFWLPACVVARLVFSDVSDAFALQTYSPRFVLCCRSPEHDTGGAHPPAAKAAKTANQAEVKEEPISPEIPKAGTTRGRAGAANKGKGVLFLRRISSMLCALVHSWPRTPPNLELNLELISRVVIGFLLFCQGG